MYEYEVTTRCDHMVAEYTGLDIFAVGEICYYDYLILLRDAVIHKLTQTEAGQDYLDKCWLMEQTKPDRKRLRQKFGGDMKNGE